MPRVTHETEDQGCGDENICYRRRNKPHDSSAEKLDGEFCCKEFECDAVNAHP
jgi:hypothetical protein